MSLLKHEILNPIASARTPCHRGISLKSSTAPRQTVALLNNSKPNVAFFLEALEKEIRTRGYHVLNVVKPRSAGPCPDIDALASRCDYVINAVAD